MIFTHTEVDPKFEGKGVGSALARFALDDVRAAGTRRVLPLCPFIKGWIGKHPDYADLVRGASADRRDGLVRPAPSSTGKCTGTGLPCAPTRARVHRFPSLLGGFRPSVVAVGGRS